MKLLSHFIEDIKMCRFLGVVVYVLVLQNGQKKKKTTICPKNTDGKCFQYAVTVALNYKAIWSHPKKVSNIKLLINKYKWKGISYPSKIDDWENFEKNNWAIALNILYIKEKEIWSAFISKINSNFEKNNSFNDTKQKKEGWYYLMIKKTIYIILKNNVKTPWWFLLLELSSFF